MTRATLFFPILCLFLFSVGRAKPGNNEDTLKPSVDVVRFERVVPLDGDGNRVARVSTREVSGRHSQTAVFQMKTHDKQFILDLELNRGLFAEGYKEVHFDANGEAVVKTTVDHCYYHGSVRGISDSQVILSTCEGLRGSFSYGLASDTHFYVEPLTNGSNEDGHLHAVFRGSDLVDANKMATCGVNNSSHGFNTLHVVHELKKSLSRPVRDVHSETKNIELLIVNDFRQYQKRGSVAATGDRAKAVANFVDSVYKALNTRVALVAVVTWNNGDKITVSTDPDTTLDNFLKYRQNTLRTAYSHDIGELLTNIDFAGTTVGIAPVKGICISSASGGINQDTSTTDTVGAIMAHEMGHNLGMEHDDGRGCTCTDTTNAGCIMEAVSGSIPPTIWSSCSVADLRTSLNDGVGSCLFNVPTQLFGDPVCGNGFVESGEECDCGSTTECPVNDPCCTPGTCKLKSTSECSKGECCDNCKFKAAGVVCRTSTNDCDLSEYCVGNSKDCPENLHKQDGTSCDSNDGYCYDGQCNTLDKQCKYLWGSSASVANDVCYNTANKRGDQYGHCGVSLSNFYIPCSTSNVLCGLLQCQGGGQFPIVGGSSQVGTLTYTIGSRMYPCKGASVDLGDDIRDPGLVNDGTKCGNNKFCISHVCTDISSRNIPACPSGSNGQVCSGNGVCNNLNKCVCNNDYLPPTCASKGTVAIDGQWGSWGQWSSCSRTCDGGVRSRSRFCDNPSPSNGGKLCSGSTNDQGTCNTQSCPQIINGGWASWSSWSSCTRSCNSGVQYRTRTCTNPAPQNGGAMCSGGTIVYQNCNNQGCPVNGAWNTWGSWGSCSKPCGTGSRTRTRQCNNPSAQNGGNPCVGGSSEQQSCNTQTCQAVLDGQWSNWGSWSACSVACGAGTRSRLRSCDNPPPQNGGSSCSGGSTQDGSCQGTQCPRDGAWSSWEEWSDCTATCGGGQRVRFRACTNPVPLHGGAACPNDTVEQSLCNTVDCDVAGTVTGWSSWSQWSECDASNCRKSRSRTCNSVSGGCEGNSLVDVDCTEGECAGSRNQTSTPNGGGGGGGSNTGAIAGAVVAVLVVVAVVVGLVVFFVRKRSSASASINRPVYSGYAPAKTEPDSGGYRGHEGYRPPPLHTSTSQERLLDDNQGPSVRTFGDASPVPLKRKAPAPPVQANPITRPAYRPPDPPLKPQSQPPVVFAPTKPSPPAPSAKPLPPSKPSKPSPLSQPLPPSKPQPALKPSAVGSSAPQTKPKPAGAVPLLPTATSSQASGPPKKAIKPPKQWPPN